MEKNAKKIFIIDDDPIVLDVLKIILTDGGHDVLTVSENNNIYEKIEDYKPDIIFLDVMMPGVNGVYILDKIKQNKTLSKIPVILVSALHDLKSIAKSYNADGFIHKPFDIEEIEKAISEL